MSSDSLSPFQTKVSIGSKGGSSGPALISPTFLVLLHSNVMAE